jgi:hypothetical protein
MRKKRRRRSELDDRWVGADGLIWGSGFPPIRQERGEWMGHPGFVAGYAKRNRRSFDSAALCSG